MLVRAALALALCPFALAPAVADESSPANAQAARYHDRIEAVARKLGWACVFVDGSSSPSKRPFAYSVGLASKSLPDLLVTGQTEKTSCYLINGVARRFLRDGRPSKGDVADIFSEGPVRLQKVYPDEFFARAAMARIWNAERHIDGAFGMQILVPDADGSFPKDDAGRGT